METTRRKFIKNASLAIAGSTLLNTKLFAAPVHYTGLQLYSVRDAMRANPAGTLKKLAAAGYKYVEHAGYADGKFYGYAPAEFKKLLDGLGLKMLSGHSSMTLTDWDNSRKDFSDVWKKTIADSAVAGQHFVINPWMDESMRNNMDEVKRLMHYFNKCGELCKSYGMKFGYHNHNFEFTTKTPDGNLYDFIIKNTDPKLVTQQMDMGNMIGAGAKAIDYIKKYPGRFQLLHVKDEIKSSNKGDLGDGYDSCILGEGVLPMKEILAAATKIGGTTHYFIEQEAYQGKDPMDCCVTDLQVMKKWGY